MVIRVTIGNNLQRKNVNLDDSTTLRNALESNGIDYSTGVTSMDGCPLQAGDLDRTFASFGITEKCSLTNVVKADNAGVVIIA